MAFGRHERDRRIWWRDVKPMRPDLMRKLHSASAAGWQGKGLWVMRKMIEQNMARVLGPYKLYAPLRRREATINSYGVAMIRHALGLTPRGAGRTRRWSYRNFYIIDVLLGVPRDMCRMVDDGLFVPGHRDGNGLQAFHVTQKGVDAAGLNGYVRKEDMRHG